MVREIGVIASWGGGWQDVWDGEKLEAYNTDRFSHSYTYAAHTDRHTCTYTHAREHSHNIRTRPHTHKHGDARDSGGGDGERGGGGGGRCYCSAKIVLLDHLDNHDVQGPIDGKEREWGRGRRRRRRGFNFNEDDRLTSFFYWNDG